MGLDGYRTYRQRYEDDGEILDTINVRGTFHPDFKNHNTIQYWMLTPTARITELNIDAQYVFNIVAPLGSTLLDRSLHEITIKNPTSKIMEVRFARTYLLIDETADFDPNASVNAEYESIFLGIGGEAYFYCTAVSDENGLVLKMRTGTHDNKN